MRCIMNQLAESQQFIENGQNHECCNLSDMVFKDLDYRRIGPNISFFRSDFSRSRFYNCTFNQNLFGRADLIDVYIENTNFDLVDFGSCLFKNALIEKSLFKKNTYHGVAIQYSYFENCVFRDEHFITNMYQCEFCECTFINCTFEKSSLDNNAFVNCEFIKVDMSECIAESLRFDTCTLRDVFLCYNLWTTYLYRNTDIYNFGFKYRGKIVDIWNGNSQDFIYDLQIKGLYFEYLNTIIVGDIIPEQGLFQEVKRLFPIIINQTTNIRKSSLSKILDMLFFYRNYYKIALEDYLEIYCFLNDYNWANIPFDENLIYQAKIYKIRKAIEYFDFDLSYMRSVSPASVCIAKFHVNTDHTDTAISYLENVFYVANRDLCEEAFASPLIKVLRQESGSVILTIASSALLAVLVSYAAKKVMHNLGSIQIERGIKKQLLNRLSQSNVSLSDIQKSCALAQKYQFLSENKDNDMVQIKSLSSELTKGEIVGIILDFLF